MKNVANQRYYLVREDVLTDAMQKTLEAKQLLQNGTVSSIWDAVKEVDLSRSAFYKYRDAVQPFTDLKTERIVTFYALLKNRAGVLSNLLRVFAASRANILTINQSIPTDGCAAVTVAAETSGMPEPLETLITAASELDGVVRFEILAG